jgi:predicted nucleic acid-binding protein
MKYLIFDAGPLINFSMNNSLDILRKLKKEFPGKFLITEKVKEEVIDYPKGIKKFEYNALLLEVLLNEKVIELPNFNGEGKEEYIGMTNHIENLANSTFRSQNRNIHLIDSGEASSLALSMMIKEPNVVAIDERTTRMLCENPENLRKLMQKKLHTEIRANKKNYDFFKKFKVIRSTELVYIANKKHLFELKSSQVLDAALYAMKYKGCSVSEREIEEIKSLK